MTQPESIMAAFAAEQRRSKCHRNLRRRVRRRWPDAIFESARDHLGQTGADLARQLDHGLHLLGNSGKLGDEMLDALKLASPEQVGNILADLGKVSAHLSNNVEGPQGLLTALLREMVGQGFLPRTILGNALGGLQQIADDLAVLVNKGVPADELAFGGAAVDTGDSIKWENQSQTSLQFYPRRRRRRRMPMACRRP